MTVAEKKLDFVSYAIFFRLLGLSGFLRYDFEESGMKYNILSGQMWPSWVFGPGFLTPPAQLPARCLLEPKRGLLEPQKGPNGWGLPGNYNVFCIVQPCMNTAVHCTAVHEYRRASCGLSVFSNDGGPQFQNPLTLHEWRPN